MSNYQVTFVLDYCTISASCDAESEESAPDLAWESVCESTGLNPETIKSVNEVIVECTA